MSRVIAIRQGQPRAVIMAGLRGAPGTGGGGSAGVSSFNGRTGAVSLTGADVTTALAYTPANAANLAAVALSGTYADLTHKPFIPTGPGDIGAASAAQGALADTAVQPGALSVQLDLKVDKVAGYGLSQENFTAAEKAKLAGLEGSHYRGTFVNVAALQAALPTAQEGDYADVDAGAGAPVQRYIWDESDSEWVAQAGSADPVTAAQVKVLYESNPDTNAYTDAEKSKLAGVAAGATANANTDSLAEGATNLYHTAARVLATVLSGLSLATGGAITSADTVLVAFGKLQKQITDLITTVSGKQDTLVSGTSIKTINGNSLLGSGNITISGGSANWGGIGGTLSDQVDLQAALDAKGLAAGMPYRIVSASGAITPEDSGCLLICTNGAAITLTVGAEATAAWSIAGVSPVVQLLSSGAGTVTVAGAAGVTIDKHASDSLTLDGQHAPAALIWRLADTWSLVGRLAAA